MRGWRQATVVGLMLCGTLAVRAEEPDKSECRTDAILVFDASGSMASADPHGNVSRIHRIREATAKVVPNVASLRNLGLMVYGGGAGSSCTDIALKVPPAPNNAKPILDALRDILPNGRTPLTESVSRAAEVLHYRTKRATVVLLTDGEESCGGDPCSLGERLHKEGVNTQVHVIDYKSPFGSDWRGTLQSRCLATATGGMYMPVNSVDDLIQALRETLSCPYVTELQQRFAGVASPRTPDSDTGPPAP